MSLAEFKALNWAHLRKARKRLLLYPLLMAFVLAVNLGLADKYRADGLDPFTILLFLAGLVLFCGLVVFGINKNIRKNYANTSLLADGMSVTLTEDIISVRSRALNSEQPWPASYKRAVRVKDWIILSSGPASAFFLADKQLAPPATMADVLALFQRKGITLQ